MSIIKKVNISEIKHLLSIGKKVKIKSFDDKFHNVSNYIEKGILPTYDVVLDNGYSVKVTQEHKFFSNEGWIKAKDITIGHTALLCENKTYSKVKSVCLVGKQKIVDITVDDVHSYFGNGIMNHNSSKSFMALQIAANAQKKGIQVIYFDSEMSIDPSFAEKFGIDMNSFMLVQAINVESVLESIADIMKESSDRYLFIWDSLAMTVCRDQNGGMAEKARIISNKLPELIVPLADTQSTFLVLNQLKANITSNAWEALSEPYMTPGGKTGIYAYSLRIWLTKRASKSSFVEDENGYRIGSEVKVTLKKSRFGTENRQCAFKILWGDSHKVGILDEESWLEAIRNSEFFVVRHGWRDILAEDKVTTQFKFQEGDFIKKLEAEPEFKKRILEILDYEMIYKFENKIGDAKTFSNIDNISDDAPEPIHQEEEE